MGVGVGVRHGMVRRLWQVPWQVPRCHASRQLGHGAAKQAEPRKMQFQALSSARTDCTRPKSPHLVFELFALCGPPLAVLRQRCRQPQRGW